MVPFHFEREACPQSTNNGMTDVPVVIVPYDPDWPRQFERERTLLTTVFGSDAVIEHVGSTSVPGVGAKPIIDAMVGLRDLAEAESRIGQMEAAGFQYVPDYEADLPDRRYFVRPRQLPRTSHVHCVVRDGEFWHKHLKFRDHLRRNADVAAEYYQLKCRLAQLHGRKREAYTAAKSEFIQRALGADDIAPPHAP